MKFKKKIFVKCSIIYYTDDLQLFLKCEYLGYNNY